ncbi:MAG: hypothetical protein UZ11_BCD004001261 [Bacteroidetes bacterium OLB11]|nr:MAG: hypothetical protein UZ11_BCD004001261 [Bacteroidetes bacterium OLB11]
MNGITKKLFIAILMLSASNYANAQQKLGISILKN